MSNNKEFPSFKIVSLVIAYLNKLLPQVFLSIGFTIYCTVCLATSFRYEEKEVIPGLPNQVIDCIYYS